MNFANFTSTSNMLPTGKLVVIFLLCAATVKVESAAIVEVPKAVNADWWKDAVIYQIYTRSFKDSLNDDGIGDISGIIEKLDYLHDSGVTAIWLPPILDSTDDSKVDFGYEVIDYTKIDSVYGTIDDFKKLVDEAHKLSIKIIMEIVPNHSSKKHTWFIESEKGEEGNKYLAYYVWAGEGAEKEPNNWRSHFNESAWSYSETRNAWYLHQFGAEQPDLNYHNQAVQDEMKEVLKIWLELGVDGFVMGDVPYLIEDIELRDEKPSCICEEGDYESLIHEYTSNQDATYGIISEWRGVIDAYNNEHQDDDPRIIITKAHTDLDKAVLYCGTPERKGAHFTYNFLLAKELTKDLKAQTIYNAIEEWTTNMPTECVVNWVLGNHDLHRVATRFNPEVVDGLNILLSFLPGVMITYNGEEIGQEDGDVDFAQGKDPMALQDEATYKERTRDFERTPFHWDDSTNAGFGTAEPWLPVSEKYESNNLKHQKRPGYTSHYHTYQILTKLRQDFTLTATVKYKELAENVIALTKEDVNGVTYVAIINTSDKKETLDLSEFPKLQKYLKVVVANQASKKHNRVLSTNNVVLDAYESIIVKALLNKEEGRSDWWEHAVIYQIYPLSFKDQDNSGTGDIQGIINKLPYLKETGITAAWLSPIYKSPQVDAGYDISDYRDIDERFGTLADFDEMVTKARELGIKIVMDFVPNHSSNEHEWFTKSENGDEGYEDFYVWHAGLNSGRNPPNNWLSLFKNSAWTKSTKRNQYYLHQFAKEQPDLNYRSPLVVNEMKDVLKFWMDKGVDGFRMDAVPYLIEDEDFENEPESGVGVPGVDHESLKHVYTSDQNGTFDIIYEWREFVDDYTKEHGGDARILMTEAYTNISNTMKYYGDDERDGGHFTFNFQFISYLTGDSNAKDIKRVIDEWFQHIPKGRINNWVLGNHDNHRVATRFGSKNVDGFNMLIAILPGVMVTYNGEEIGQENGEVTWEQCKDPRACSGKPEDFEKNSRDFERTPFHWDDSVNAGFNDGAEPWLPVSEKYVQLNLAAQTDPDKQSHYNVYKELIQLRSKPVLAEGEWKVEAISDNVLIVTRHLTDGDTYILLFNIGDEIENIEIKTVVSTVTSYLEVMVRSSQSYHSIGDLVSSEKLALNAHESLIIATTTAIPTTTSKPTTEGGDGAAEVTISIITLIVALFCSVFVY